MIMRSLYPTQNSILVLRAPKPPNNNRPLADRGRSLVLVVPIELGGMNLDLQGGELSMNMERVR